MNVGELIELLKGHSPSTEVLIETSSNDHSYTLTEHNVFTVIALADDSANIFDPEHKVITSEKLLFSQKLRLTPQNKDREVEPQEHFVVLRKRKQLRELY